MSVFAQAFYVFYHVSCARRGLYNTGVAFIFWSLTLIADVVTFRSLILQRPVSVHP